MELNKEMEIQEAESGILAKGFSRRRFLQFTGGVAGAGLVMSSCHRTPPDTIFIGSGDVALLNYLYMMEQVLVGFYTQANRMYSTYYGMNASELQLTADLRDHQIIHKALLQKLLGSNVTRDIVVNLSSVTFASRTDTLQHAAILEDLAVSAYNGAGPRFTDTTLARQIAKMAVVQARHSAYVRDVLTPNSFYDSVVVDANGLSQSVAPSVVMTTLINYIQDHLDTRNLPA